MNYHTAWVINLFTVTTQLSASDVMTELVVVAGLAVVKGHVDPMFSGVFEREGGGTIDLGINLDANHFQEEVPYVLYYCRELIITF